MREIEGEEESGGEEREKMRARGEESEERVKSWVQSNERK